MAVVMVGQLVLVLGPVGAVVLDVCGAGGAVCDCV